MITFDLETKSEADLKKVGPWSYSEHPSTDVICACWGIDSHSIQEWWPGKGTYNSTDKIPAALYSALVNKRDTIEFHNCAFEISMWANVLAPKYEWPSLPLDQVRDTMAVACYLGLPAALGNLARVLGFPPKDPEGDRLITRYSKLYLKTARKMIPTEDFRKFVDYCRHDVALEQAVGDHMGDLPEAELEVFQHELKMNMRGLFLDLEGIAAATDVVDQRTEEITGEFLELTGLKPTQRDKVMAWCAERGTELDNLQAEYLKELLEDEDLPQGSVRRAIELRTMVNKASTKKLDAMARQCGRDGRARFQSRYHGAVTGRPTGTGFQPLNLNRGYAEVPPDELVANIHHRDPAHLDLVYGDAMDAVARASRHWIMADRGCRIMAGDFASIEAVGLACLAGEDWKIKAFRDREPIYELGACRIHKLPLAACELARDDPKAFKKQYPHERQDGKTRELAGGYQGWLGAWLKFDSSGRHSDEEIKRMMGEWRQDHPAIVQFWRNLDEAAVAAVRNPGLGAKVKDITFIIEDEWLTMILPDGKRLWYRDPQLRAVMPQWHRPADKDDCAEGTCDCRLVPQVTYMAQKEGQWKRVSSYGGKWAENATQAACRQVMVAAVKRLRAAGYPLVLTVYDEAVAEVPLGQGSLEEFRAIMEESPGEWASEWPIRAEVWEGDRYRK